MRAWIVAEADDEGMTLEGLLDDPSLDTDAAAVDQADLAQPGAVGCGDVFVDDRRDVAGLEGVEIQLAFDGDADRLRIRRTGHTRR